MNLVRHMLGLSSTFSADDKLTTAIALFNEESSVPPFQPIITSKSQLEQARRTDRHGNRSSVSIAAYFYISSAMVPAPHPCKISVLTQN